MKVGIYSESFEGNTLGGREFIVAVLCQMLQAQGHLVEFIHHMPALSPELFACRFGLRTEEIRLRYVAARPPATLRDFARRFRERQRWNRGLSEPYDCFVNIVHGLPLKSSARFGVLMVLFPFFDRSNVWAGRCVPGRGKSRLWVLLRYLRDRLQTARALRSYALATSISRYAQEWTGRRWDLKTEVLYPPSEAAFVEKTKSNLILSLGRFSAEQPKVVNKRQREMMQTFLELSRESAGWQYVSAGWLGPSPLEQDYFASIKRLAADCGGRAEAIANIDRNKLTALYGSARIFWHAAGLGNDEERTPELSEHYGIATVDAMSAGCVPVVIRKGAQGEIVEHGVSGFLFDNLEELKRYTLHLINDPTTLERMAANARERAKRFTRSAFVERFNALMQETFPEFYDGAPQSVGAPLRQPE